MSAIRSGEPITDDTYVLFFNAHHDKLSFRFPRIRTSRAGWELVLDTARESGFLEEKSHYPAAGTLELVEQITGCSQAWIDAAKVPSFSRRRIWHTAVSDGVSPRIPTATYRLQFHAGFTFDDAREILDYLRALGISDVYASPYFQSAPGSTHGYDVSDHNRLNPLIGDDASFRAYCSALKEHEMGQVLDFVPNHMGIGGPLNAWWMDVLEDGRLSAYARYFDIDWRPANIVLSDRILLPILGDRYGKVARGWRLQTLI